VGHEKNVIYSKLVNNPFKQGDMFVEGSREILLGLFLYPKRSSSKLCRR